MGALTTLTAVKLHLGITDTSEDSLLSQLINQASADIARRCRRTLTRETRTEEKYTGDGGTEFYLKLYPVVSISAVTVDGEPVTDYELAVASGLLTRDDGWLYGARIKVTYTGGYLLTTIPAVVGPPAIAEVPRTIPDDLEYAAILWVASAYNSRGSEHLSDEKIGPLGSVFWPEQPAVRNIIANYDAVTA